MAETQVRVGAHMRTAAAGGGCSSCKAERRQAWLCLARMMRRSVRQLDQTPEAVLEAWTPSRAVWWQRSSAQRSSLWPRLQVLGSTGPAHAVATEMQPALRTCFMSPTELLLVGSRSWHSLSAEHEGSAADLHQGPPAQAAGSATTTVGPQSHAIRAGTCRCGSAVASRAASAAQLTNAGSHCTARAYW